LNDEAGASKQNLPEMELMPDLIRRKLSAHVGLKYCGIEAMADCSKEGKKS
jgi:hypothetical protein